MIIFRKCLGPNLKQVHCFKKVNHYTSNASCCIYCYEPAHWVNNNTFFIYKGYYQ